MLLLGLVGGRECGVQIQIILSREVGLHRDHNKSIACRRIKTLLVNGKRQAASGGRFYSGK